MAPDTSERRLREIRAIHAERRLVYRFSVVDDLLAMIEERDERIAEQRRRQERDRDVIGALTHGDGGDRC